MILVMTLLPFTVGSEIEFNSCANTVSDLSRDPVFSRLAWTFACDSSCGYEIRSPIMRTLADITSTVDKVCTAMNDHGVNVDQRCGFHVHIGMQGIRDFSAKYRLFRLCCHYESAIFQLARQDRRNNRFCKKLSPQIRAYMALGKGWHAWSGHEDRYHWVNGVNMAENNTNKTTVEFRLMESSFFPGQITGWIATLLCMVNTACSNRRKLDWNDSTPSDLNSFMRDAGITDNIRLPELAALAREWITVKTEFLATVA